VEISVNITFLA